MGKYVQLPEYILVKITTMRKQGYGCTIISRETKIPINIVRNRLYKLGLNIYSKNKKQMPAGKYDHLFEEPRCQGKMYSEYKGAKKINLDL